VNKKRVAIGDDARMASSAVVNGSSLPNSRCIQQSPGSTAANQSQTIHESRLAWICCRLERKMQGCFGRVKRSSWLRDGPLMTADIWNRFVHCEFAGSDASRSRTRQEGWSTSASCEILIRSWCYRSKFLNRVAVTTCSRPKMMKDCFVERRFFFHRWVTSRWKPEDFDLVLGIM